jgi:hypothetical protein
MRVLRLLARDLTMTEKTDSFWPALLPEIEKAITLALESVAAQEMALAAMMRPENGATAGRLESIRDRIFGLKACVDRPEQMIAEFDAILAAGEKGARDYSQEIDGLRQRLADWTTCAIG